MQDSFCFEKPGDRALYCFASNVRVLLKMQGVGRMWPFWKICQITVKSPLRKTASLWGHSMETLCPFRTTLPPLLSLPCKGKHPKHPSSYTHDLTHLFLLIWFSPWAVSLWQDSSLPLWTPLLFCTSPTWILYSDFSTLPSQFFSSLN